MQAKAAGACLLHRVELDGDRLVLLVDPRGVELRGAVLVGTRATVPGQVAVDVAGVVTLSFDLHPSRWGVSGLALPSGDYVVRLAGPAGDDLPMEGVAAQEVLTDLFRARVAAEDGGLVLQMSAPLRDDEIGTAQQRRLRLAALRPRRKQNAVCFESFYGRTASDNPLGIDRAVARLLPDVTRYWCVTDRSVAVPEGAVPLVQFSEQWWRVRAHARLVVANDWLRWTYPRQPGQHVLQTWHGTMLKRLALDRPGRPPLQRLWVVRQSLRWSALLAQNDYSAQVLRRAYAFRGPVWVTGYPRNDVLADTARATRVREVLGIDADARVVLWAPTWRDDRAGLVEHLDVAAFAAGLPHDHVVVVRGHSRTLAHGADLLLVADVLVTDYSSLMFDFAATGRPLVLFVPDLDHYADVLRGFYFDLRDAAPGPLVDTVAELRSEVLRAQPGDERYAERLATWQQRFTPLDADGRAGERVVRELLRRRWLRAPR